MSKAIKITRILIAATFFVLPVFAVQAEDDFKVCARCHGPEGNSDNSDVPSIAGLSARYIEASLHAYHDGKRECGTSKMKCRMAAKWTDEEMAGSATHFAQFKRVAPEQVFDSALAQKGKAIHEEHCASCHSAQPQAEPDSQPAGELDGQWREYLEYALEQYAGGGREQPDKMRAALEALSEDQKDELLNYYASGL